MRIIADRDIPQVQSAFSEYGDVELVSGRTLTPAQLGDAEILLVRSVTRVNKGLLEHSKIRYVGTATSGIDHLDTRYLQERGIAYFDAAGCNARAVAEYVVACSFLHGRLGSVGAAKLTAGIIGYGHVGKIVHAMFSALGVRCVVNDPLLEHDLHDVPFVDLADALQSDIVTLHVPFTELGEFPTRGMIGATHLAQMRAGTLLINAARGGVIDEQSLITWLAAHPSAVVAIDCWHGEPIVDLALLGQAAIATPHIAGHTNEARLRATTMLSNRIAAKLGFAPVWAATPVRPLELQLQAPGSGGPQDVISDAVLRCCDPRLATVALRRTADLSTADRAAAFDALRQKASSRHEFSGHRVACDGLQSDTVRGLCELGFATTMNGKTYDQ